MSLLKLFHTEKLYDDRILCSYQWDKSSLDSCRAVSNLNGFSINKIRVTIEGEEMQPDKKVTVDNFLEIFKLAKIVRISSCLFKGVFDEKNVNIVINFDTDEVRIASKDTGVIEKIKSSLEDL